jgi:hypothetical protein
MFGFFKKRDPQLEAAKKAFDGLVYKESKGGSPRNVFWVGRAPKSNTIRVGVKFNDRTYFLDAVDFAKDLTTRKGWEVISK